MTPRPLGDTLGALLPAVAISLLLSAAPFTESDLSPALPADAAGAPAALSAGKPEEALRLLRRHDQPEARLVRALALLRIERAGEALRALDGLEAALPEVADRVATARGRALGSLGRWKEAAEALGQVPAGSVLAAAAAVARGKALAAAGAAEAAAKVLAQVGSLGAPGDASVEDHPAAALALLGDLLARRDPAAARAALLSCWIEHPLAAESDGCLPALRRLAGEAGREPTDEQAVQRAERLVEANRNKTAIALLERATARLGPPAADAPLACRARSALGRAYRRERQHRKAIEALRPVVEACADPGVRLRALFVLAGSVGIAGEREEAVALYRRLAKEFPDSSLADDALVSAGDLLERLGREDEALAAFAAAAGAAGEGDKRAEAQFRLAWAARRGGDATQAIARLRAMEAEYRERDPYEHARAAYWLARTMARQGPEGAKAAEAIFLDLVRRYPVDWYGLLARIRLGETNGGAADALPAPLKDDGASPLRFDAAPLSGERHFAAAVRLLRIGLGPEAAEELRAIDLDALRKAGPEPLFLVAALLDRAGDHRSSHGILRNDGKAVLRAIPSGDGVRLWRIAYPNAFRDDVVRWAAAAAVPPELLQALMREESALDPDVVSHAGAVGLTQLMPSTASAVARKLGLGAISPASLVNPATNIRIGAAYLGELLRRYAGQPALALAAYNAGENAVGRWLAARGALDLDEFVEEIPIDETRGYVKRVLRSFAAYRLLSGRPAGAPLRLAGHAAPT